MTSLSLSQKDGLLDLPVLTPSEQPSSKSAYFNAISPLTKAWNRYSEWRTNFGLPNTGTVEQLQKEVKGDPSLFSIYFGRDPHTMPRSNACDKLLIRGWQGRPHQKPVGESCFSSDAFFRSRIASIPLLI